MIRLFGVLLVALIGISACSSAEKPVSSGGFVYQLQGYASGRLDEVAAAPFRMAVIDLARDASGAYFTADEVALVKNSGKKVLAYFEIGAIENFRPEYAAVKDSSLMLNEWPSWPGEFFVRYWEERWWDTVVRPRVDRALAAGFDGVYLDTPLAYEEIELRRVPALTRDELGTRMAALIVRISSYAKRVKSGFSIFPQNNPELQKYPGFADAIDGIGMEELFFQATDQPCTADFCAENLQGARELRKAGKTVLAIDYANQPENIANACRRYRDEGFEGYVTVRALDRISAPCK
ncbi:cysteinyl-tRNA synthetase, unknown class [Amycolatopsis xylanica]|uniref:Glycoside-hydrolase family GH114 TIM-barrel domain-containing protein n=1 Tax=Amycolatopsis xylanica TaxID=589385 RepID=A0A1H2VVS0_9PSEU|nr:cysteinyl-tRNA synthetase, unknown class [Amycolatopsis xylanica]